MIRAIVVAAVIVAGLAAPAHAQEAPSDVTIHRVKKDDTLGILASEYYGDRNKAIFIMVKNNITHPRPLKPGERLRIPVSRPLITAPDDTFESIAGSYLGDPRRGAFLASFNNLSPDDALPAGTPLSIPFTVTHTAQASESLAQIALAYFNDAKIADMLRRYNFLDKTVLDRGESIIVPVFNVRLQASKLPPVADDAKLRLAARREATRDAAAALPKAWSAWRAGEVGAIEVLLTRIDVAYLDPATAIDVLLLRGLAHVAEGKLPLAVDDFKAVVERKPDFALDRFDYSPRIRDVWKQAGGAVR